MNIYIRILTLLLLIAFPWTNSFAQSIMSSIKPVDSLVKMIALDDKDTSLLVNYNKSPHGFRVKPSDVAKIKEAKIIFYIDDSFEEFLSDALKNSKDIRKVSLLQNSKLRLLNARTSKVWESKKVKLEDANIDSHIWLDTKNAKQMLKTIKNELINFDPQNTAIYKSNYKKAVQDINELYEHLRNQLKMLEDKKFMVFHDAGHYFEKQFNLNNAGSIVTNPHFNVSIKSLKHNRLKARDQDIKCVFYEPQFNKKFSNMVAKSSSAKVSRLDPIGFNLEPSRDLYFKLMRNLADSYLECLL